MITIINKCKKCNRNIRDIELVDSNSEIFTSFFISYCPNCVELRDKIEVIVTGKTIKMDNKEMKENGK